MADILKSLHGRIFGLAADSSDERMRLVAKGGIVVGSHGSQMEYSSPSRVVHNDDFIGDVISTNWGNPTKGSDGATVDFAHLTGPSGLVKGTTGAGAGASMAANGIQLHSALQWKANQSTLPRKTVFETRIKLSSIATVALFVGFTDQIAALEMPATLGGSDALTTNFSDGAGWLFDTGADTDNWWMVGVANNTDATKQNSGYAPVADTFETLRVELASDGSATFFRNGAQVGTAMSGAVTATIALTPVIAAFSRAAAAVDVTIDYISVAGDRV